MATDVVQGTVRWFDADEGYGVIVVDGGGGDVYVHQSAVDPTGARTLHEHERVEFELQSSHRGPRANRVRTI